MKPYYEHDRIVIYHGDSREIVPSLAFDVLITDPPYGVSLGDHSGGAERRTYTKSASGSGRALLVKQAAYVDTPEHFKAERSMVFLVPPSMWQLPPPDAIGGVFVPSAVGRNKWGWSNLVHCLLYGIAPGLERGAKQTAITGPATAEKTGHPVTKPLAWMRWAVELGASPTNVILDPFAGSGTTLRAAKDTRRAAIGIGINERFCEIAAKRLEQEVLF